MKNDDEIDFNVSNIKVDIDPKDGKLLIVLMILFLIGGFVIGCLAGATYMNSQWKEYHEEYEERVERYCTDITIPETNFQVFYR